jgi:hypothetical protein
LPDVQKSPLIQNLVQQRVRVERQVSELSVTLLPAHPRMRQLNADLAGLERQIEAETAKVVDGLEKESKVAALREESIQKSLGELKARIVNTGPNEAKLRGLEANVKSKRAELERLQSQFEANRVRADSRAVPVEAQVVARARASSVPSFPKKLPFAVLFTVATFLLGIALIVTRALLFGSRRTISAVHYPRHDHEPIDLPSLSPVSPTERPSASDNSALAVTSPRVVQIQSIPEIARRLGTDKAPSAGGLRTLVTGEVESIAVWEEAGMLASALATGGSSVILVDWSPEGRGISRMLGQACDPGIAELLDGSANFEDVVGCLPDSGVHFIPAGAGAGNEEKVLDPDRINVILDALDEVYDHIIVAGRREAARKLFEVIQGRFDAGVTIAEARQRIGAVSNPLETFLGYEVDEIDLIYFERPVVLRAQAGQRLHRSGNANALRA